ncbi:Zn(II)2Cys6 transcription factor domain-containing protein [Aspergillus mulundensis]|uniref:Putative Zn(II)2Cys6 transcription factor n=1 Tax=Aspergillus mulundensis TaxID=1810919 RepID=A0A3D8SDM1_9EURO|nr:putative Zn(II)2Cys6 transcription factor [Aspergillus mulundensis]RDW84204.1 putative Zn(II)2Cys6 transcription factor [Aspergillus mulundensis]
MPLTPQQRRKSRNKEIPLNLIQTWQCPGNEGARPVVRRPITACDACRAAKVKCTGLQNACDRCTGRGLACKYTTPSSSSRSTASSSPPNTSSSTSSNRQSPSTAASSISGSNKSSDAMAMEWVLDSAEPLNLDDVPGHDFSSMVDWPKDMSSQMVDWSTLDFSQNTIDLNALGTGTGGIDVFTPPAQATLLPGQDASTINPASMTVPTLPLPPFHEPCHCRANLMAQVPEVKDAMHRKPRPQLDRIFKVTGNVLYACRDLVGCPTCQINYADLVCVMAVLQQTETCFEHIAKEGLSTSAIRVSVGEYEVPIGNEIKLGHILVMDLVSQANCLLKLLRKRSQVLVQTQSAAQSRMAQLNMEYLQEVVKSFGQTLRAIADSFDGQSQRDVDT